MATRPAANTISGALSEGVALEAGGDGSEDGQAGSAGARSASRGAARLSPRATASTPPTPALHPTPSAHQCSATPPTPTHPHPTQVPKLSKLSDDQAHPRQSIAGLRARGKSASGLKAGPLETDAHVLEAYGSLRAVQHALTTLSELPGSDSAPVPGQQLDLPLKAYAKQLESLYKLRARQSVQSPEERAAWAAHYAYSIAQAEADAARAARTQRNRQLTAMRISARAWEVAFRTVYSYVFRYMASLRGAINPSTG